MRTLFTALTALALSACAQLAPRPTLPIESAAPARIDSALDRAVDRALAARPGESAFRLLSDGPEAFAARVQSARVAVRSLDVQTYIWRDDLTGSFLAHSVLEAADRGVSVRLLIDDLAGRPLNATFGALAAHPKIAVRLFNPFASRSGTLSFMLEGLGSFRRINHRMHNKSWIADNRIAIAGGRNLGDEYFGASEHVNFVDLDLAMIGPIVQDASASFDLYWNSAAAFPIELLDADAVDSAALDALRTRLLEVGERTLESAYARALRDNEGVVRLVSGAWPMEWSNRYGFIADDPLKAMLPERDLRRSHVLSFIGPAVQKVNSDLAIISPYFVPGDAGAQAMVGKAATGARVRVITNSLAANDVAAVHGGYSRHRKTLLAGGVQLWELKPAAQEVQKTGLLPASGASLHTKALLSDSRTVFVGSYNLDPRSTWLNCEQIVYVDNERLAAQLAELFEKQSAGERAWRVTLENKNDLRWSDGAESFEKDPRAGFGRRFQAWFARAFRLDALL